MGYKAAVITVSDKASRGERVDTSGPAVKKMLEEAGYSVIYMGTVPDEQEEIKAELIKCADNIGTALCVTTGGTGFSPRDVTPEATKAVIERETPGIPEAMRAESLRITPRGSLSRSAAGIRGGTLIVNLPGSEKAARENLSAVLPALEHGLKMLESAGSADCAVPVNAAEKSAAAKNEPPSWDAWLKDAKKEENAGKIGMYIMHNGVVRETAKALAREGKENTKPVTGMDFDYDADKVNTAVEETKKMPGVEFVRIWLAGGRLKTGDDMMRIMIGADIRPNAVKALDSLLDKIKGGCVTEKEIY